VIQKILHSSRIDKVDNVIHIADVHIRNFKRHDEYESVFNRVYDYCKEQVQQDKNTIIYLAGDIVHAKTDMSPELIVMTRNFLVNLSDIAPVLLIAGNHDMNLNNRNRLDALSPIVDSIDTPDFFYLKDTGVYNLGGVNFILNAVHEDPDNFIKAEDVVGDGIKVVFYHGAIDRADIGFGQTIKNNRINIDMFRDFDFGMFGDIHGFQYLHPNNKFAYAGSLIQQNFGEGLVHGIIHWNLREGKSTFVQIPNDWSHYTIDIDDGKFVNLPTEFSIHNRIRVRSYNTPNSELMKAVAKLKSIVKVDDIRIQKFSTKPTNGQTQSTISIGDVRDVEYQNKLIGDYLEKEFAVEEEVIDEVRKINRTINTNLDKSVVLRNVIWNPIKFEFDNMFSYGEGNKIDFSQMNGTYGIFAANASGKSSVLDALMFCIFDKCSRTFKAAQVLNNKKDTFRCKFQFQINGKDYWIERIATKDKRGHVKVNVDFWHEENGEKISLNGDDRDGTNFAIRNYLGTYDDFIITAFSLQGNNTNFIDKAQRERKDLLAQFLDLNLFEELSTIASDEIKSVQTLIREYSRQDYSTKIADANDNLKRSQLDLDEINEERDLYTARLDSKNEVIMELTKALKPIDDRLMDHNLEELTQKKDEFVRKVVSCREETEQLEIELGNENKILSELQSQFDSIDSDTLNTDWQVLQETTQSISKTKHKLENIRLQIEHNQSKIDKLSTHEYDPDCKFCTNNVFVQDAKSAEEILVDLFKEVGILELELTELGVIEQKLNYVEEQRKNYQDLERKVLGKQKQIHEIEKKISQNGITCDDLTSKTEKIEDLIISYIENEGIIKENQEIQSKISVAERERNDFTSELKRLETKYITLAGEIKVYEKTIQDCAESIKKLQELEKQFKAYDFYLKSVNRNGVPYQLISDAMPKVQAEVNSILSQIVDFEILFETDGKSINTYIVYDDENFWPLEMTSGMEKFISSLAIRTALVNVSSLPRPNFMAIDEGFGVLDSENLNSLHMFFDYMKTQFDFLLTISHIDALRDIMDSIIEIKKENGFSNVRF
jgi:DNA repair exonuclease SbcCD ATPase subunit